MDRNTTAIPKKRYEAPHLPVYVNIPKLTFPHPRTTTWPNSPVRTLRFGQPRCLCRARSSFSVSSGDGAEQANPARLLVFPLFFLGMTKIEGISAFCAQFVVMEAPESNPKERSGSWATRV